MFKSTFSSRLVRLLQVAMLLLAAAVAHAEEDFLDPEKAFKFSARMLDQKTAEVTYTIADGYYMYRERFAVKADGATVGEPVIPPGKVKYDETFQKNVETYRKAVTITVPVDASGNFTLRVTGQGCADQGLCYPPMESTASLSPTGGAGLLSQLKSGSAAGNGGMSLSGAANSSVNSPAIDTPASQATGGTRQAAIQDESDMGRIEASLKSGKLSAILPLFLLLGIGLSFTPCVLPMMPILSSIILGEGTQVRRGRGFALSVAYSLGMALVYTALGIAAGFVGEGLSAALQNPWMLGAFALLMAGLSLSMFGVYQLQVPAALQQKLVSASDRQAAGKMAGVFAMGAISALIVGPCVAAPLAGALLYISQTRDVIIGGSALFAMAIGMSVPLMLIGVSAGTLLPRAGAWMESVKYFFGVLMLGLAIWIVMPVLPAWIAMVGWAALGIGYGAYLLFARRWKWVAKAFGVVFVLLGAVQLVGAATGGRDALAPLAHLTGAKAGAHVQFKRIKSVAELDAALASTNGKTAMLDFYADWCVSCKEMEKLTFSDPRVQGQLAGMVLLQADVTANNEDDKALLRRFKLFGPPGIIFFDRQGKEIQGGRVIGYQNADKFTRSLDAAGKG
ncbi:protein-disulfide reductase DsbD [Noviherbaspirillum galbum]|uniref:Thiol:disulfide interchange protein DsbD n=1 Tax=Noviherbaspirillum galbum TaxID=2709383 RepID=A0A6B3SL14_9BURK|nr:protein-disulfide reductase DsbD [Noviherbaspirillum galbum]NEX61483.1 protein-disulfide reductase DsbD [Noviherbaspirillum galbum]